MRKGGVCRVAGHVWAAAAVVLACAGLGAQTSQGPQQQVAVPAQPAPEVLWAVTSHGTLVRLLASRPDIVEPERPLIALAAGDELVGMDFRVAKGVLYTLSRSGKLYTVNTATASLNPVGAQAPLAVPLRGTRWGVDFNPAADRIRVVSDEGQNLRLHPETGAVVDFDPSTDGVQPDPDLRYADGDRQAGHRPQLVSAGYTYNTRDDKLTTNFAIDARLGTLVTQGSREGDVPVESPNLGVLRTVGELGTGPLLDAAFDISDVRNTAWLAARTAAEPRTTLYRVDLTTGVAQRQGVLGNGQALLGLAIEP